METDQLYTSSLGGNHFFPALVSRSRKRFSSRNSFVTISSLRSASQDSCSVSISSLSRSRCSGVSDEIHFCLSNLEGAGSGAAVEDDAPLPLFAAAVTLGAPKKDVMLPWTCLAFLGSDPGWVPALRLRADMVKTAARGRRLERRRRPAKRRNEGSRRRDERKSGELEMEGMVTTAALNESKWEILNDGILTMNHREPPSLRLEKKAD